MGRWRGGRRLRAVGGNGDREHVAQIAALIAHNDIDLAGVRIGDIFEVDGGADVGAAAVRVLVVGDLLRGRNTAVHAANHVVIRSIFGGGEVELRGLRVDALGGLALDGGLLGVALIARGGSVRPLALRSGYSRRLRRRRSGRRLYRCRD